MAEGTLDGTLGLRDRYNRLMLVRFHAMLANPKFLRVRRKWLRRPSQDRLKISKGSSQEQGSLWDCNLRLTIWSTGTVVAA